MGAMSPLHDGQEGTAPVMEATTGSGARVVVRRSSSTSMVVVEQSSRYEMRRQQGSPPTNVDLANSSRATRPKPTTNHSSAKANSDENANTAAADDDDGGRTVLSRANGLPSMAASKRDCTPSQPGVNQRASSNNNNNKGNHNNNEEGRHSQWSDTAPERKQLRRPIVLMAASPQDGNKIGERANYYHADASASGNGRLMSGQASDYSSLHADTPDLGATIAEGFCEGAQMDRAHFYHNLFQVDDVRLFAIEHEPGWRVAPARSSTLPATPKRAATAAANCAPNGSTAQIDTNGSWQQVRPSEELAGARKSRARTSASAGPRGATRMGKFVNYYPAERQPLGVVSPARKRHTSPYSFHVPVERQQQQQLYKRPVSRTRSPVYRYSPAGQQQQQQQQQYYDQLEDSPMEDEAGACGLAAEVKQARYGYVAPIERQRRPPLGRFNKSLRSRTIGHIPSMVQVSVDDNSLVAVGRRDGQVAAVEPNNRSEADLLRTHRIAWHQSNKFDVGHDNPFRPGTELSLEADLMVRLIKRGYPIGELPHLVEATKGLLAGVGPAQARSKSCDKLLSPARIPAAGYLDSNLRQFNESHQQGRELANDRPADPISHSHSYSHFTQANKQVDELEPCRRVWASSLSRAKSMPRFNYSADQPLEATPRIQTRAEDTDSLDKLITKIEQEIGNLLERDAARDEKNNCGLVSHSGSIDGPGAQTKCLTNSPSRGEGNKGLSKRKTSTQSATLRRGTPNEQAERRRLPSSTSTPSFMATGNTKARVRNDDLTSSRSNELLLAELPEGKSRVIVTERKRKKSRCCLIQ